MNKEVIKNNIEMIVRTEFAKSLKNANDNERYYAVSKAILNEISQNWEDTSDLYKEERQAFYLSAEFLMGRAFGNNLINLGLYEEIKELLTELNIDINDIEEAEEDAGLGNGGLGRLAACFMDSCATLNMPVTGYGIRYDYGIFKQKFENGYQVEEADNWLKNGDPWSIERRSDTIVVEFGDGPVNAVPVDMPITGFKTKNVNTLRLWKAESIVPFDFEKFNDQAYDESVELKNRAEDISRVLYPNDSTDEGKILRLKQQYFFVSASIQDIVRKFKAKNGSDFSKFADLNAVQLNDTHPVVAIPELMRILMDEENMTYDESWAIVLKVFAYTNHTILSEALEKWSSKLFSKLLPRVYEIVVMIDKNFVKELETKEYGKDQIEKMRIIGNDGIRMAWLAIHGGHAINGVAEIHTELLKTTELSDWNELYPEKFQNKTNGITPRRWIALCNPELTSFITELLGTDQWLKDLDMLKDLEKYVDDETMIKKFLDIKLEKKKQLKAFILENEGIEIDENSLFDIQIKRLHEYKRQLLSAFHILDLYYRIKENPQLDMVPRTFIFGAKSAPGYVRAKGIIKFINEIGELVNNDKDIDGKIKVVFVQNYRVTYGQMLFPAADISEQISTAGKEASGTGNMKFMLNGTPTIGTLDGANVEIVEVAGEENNFIFGATVDELAKMADSYDPKAACDRTEGLKKVVDSLIDGSFDDGDSGMFKELHDSIFKGASWHVPDNYFIMEDFEDYRRAQNDLNESFKNQEEYGKKCWMNMCNAGKFNSDRTILDYSREIWYIKPNML